MKLKAASQAIVKSSVPAWIAAVASLIVPGLGQMLVLQIRRGLLLLGSTATIVTILGWRIQLLAHREASFAAMLAKAVQRRPAFVIGMIVLTALLWLWASLDAYQKAKNRASGGPAIFALVITVFFILGWQISQIDVYKAVTELPDALPPLSKVLWPWRAAITYRTESLTAAAAILVPCAENSPVPTERTAGEPYLVSDPTCGVMSEMDKQGNIIPGTILHLEGDGFRPDTVTQIWWVDPIGNEFRPRQDSEYVVVTTDENGVFEFDLIIPYRLIAQSEGRQIHHVEARQISRTGGAIPAEPLLLTIERMVETIMMGMMATLFGIVLSIPISFLAARNLMSASWVTLTVYYITRTILNIVRAIEPLIWALIAVVWVGLGPFAGIIALTVHSVAALGKLYSEAIESIDPGPIEAIQATGATRLQTIVYAVVPQMIPPFVSFSIYRWDINVRMSTVIGLVGGGGVGFILIQYIRLLNYRAAGIAVWFIAVTVAILDYVSSEIRRKFI